MCIGRKQDWGSNLNMSFFLEMKNFRTQMVLSSLLLMEVGTLEEKGCYGGMCIWLNC